MTTSSVALISLSFALTCAQQCKYFSLNPGVNDTAEYIAPDVCFQNGDDNEGIWSYYFACSQDGQSITERKYNGANCTGNFEIMAVWSKSAGWDMNCDATAIDCSSTLRFYDTCHPDEENFDSTAIVTGICGTYEYFFH